MKKTWAESSLFLIRSGAKSIWEYKVWVECWKMQRLLNIQISESRTLTTLIHSYQYILIFTFHPNSVVESNIFNHLFNSQWNYGKLSYRCLLFLQLPFFIDLEIWEGRTTGKSLAIFKFWFFWAILPIFADTNQVSF